MPGVILGLDIGERYISAVRIKGGLRGLEPLGWGHVNLGAGEDPAGALGRLAGQLDLSGDMALVSLPPCLFSFRNVSLPFQDLKKIRQALPFELESMVARPIEEMIVGFCAYDRNAGSKILAALLPKEVISRYLMSLKAAGIDPDVITIGWLPVLSRLIKRPATPENGLLLELGTDRTTLYGFSNKKVALIRDLSPVLPKPSYHGLSDSRLSVPPKTEDGLAGFLDSLVKEVAATLHSFTSQQGSRTVPERLFLAGPGANYPGVFEHVYKTTGILCEKVDSETYEDLWLRSNRQTMPEVAGMLGAFALAAWEARKAGDLNFRKQGFELERDRLGIRRNALRTGIAIGVVVSLFSANLWVEYSFLKKKYDRLGEGISEIYRQSFPNAKRIVDPLQQMKVAINEAARARGSTGGVSGHPVIEIMMDLSKRIAPSVEMRIARLLVDQDSVRITGRTDTFNTVNIIKGQLEPSDFYTSVTISSATLDQSGKGVQFELNLQRARR
ncbi:MAG: hypothetical protein C4582_13675 [Desulfobacteraceae bacterium]|nr:MAG: hypothetical protein C4582_13675 [Desulfobacteraceae bacterium]